MQAKNRRCKQTQRKQTLTCSSCRRILDEANKGLTKVGVVSYVQREKEEKVPKFLFKYATVCWKTGASREVRAVRAFNEKTIHDTVNSYLGN